VVEDRMASPNRQIKRGVRRPKGKTLRRDLPVGGTYLLWGWILHDRYWYWFGFFVLGLSVLGCGIAQFLKARG